MGFAPRTGSAYDALNSLLCDVDDRCLRNPATIVQALSELLGNRAAGGPVLLALDNVELLDPASAVIVAQLVADGVGKALIGASDYFAEKSGGNPLFLRSIVLHAVRSRGLVLSDGIYVLLDEPDEVDPALADLVAGNLRDVPAPERDALDAISLAGAVPFVLLSAMAGDAAVRRLRASGLVRAVP